MAKGECPKSDIKMKQLVLELRPPTMHPLDSTKYAFLCIRVYKLKDFRFKKKFRVDYICQV